MFNLLKKRGVLFISLSNAVSQLGDRLTYMVIVTLIGIMSPGQMTAYSEFSITFTLPVILLSPFVGVIIDHSNKRQVILRCHLMQSILIFLTPAVVAFSNSSIPIWTVVVLFFSLDVFNNTARNSLVPDLVDYQQLVPANAIITTIARIATFAGMVGGGLFIKWVGWQLGFYIDATTHLIAGLLVLGIGARYLFEPVKKVDISLRKELKNALKLFINDLKELLILLRRDRMVIFVMISVMMLPFVAAIAHTVLVFMIQQTFGLGTAGVGLLGGIIGLGMLLGGIVMGLFGKKFSRGSIILFSIAVLTILFITGPIFLSTAFLYAMSLISGMLFSFIGISQDTILQEDVAKAIRGRIFATKEFFVNITFLSASVSVGLISKLFNPLLIIQLIGFFLLLIFIFTLLIYRSIPKEIRAKL
ncbi:hypothetical protein A2Y85_06325 [candidate division WOR-3 bacterium RBG_13_43_14]|uniref:Major facilitator superfamily (MFS) profile domain-containing protein n=1 Tax=candidate division WOR-3 bacterium RBG_13_43_14 TaxID=1802590 RepID=A0A1F4UCQ0_UNCW3|nr:MAG: hypothetical protein A2Y85_06325 [candidate division WOR-3 bacterium RBG_13_43_14]